MMYAQIWAVPGMPQLLLKDSLLSQARLDKERRLLVGEQDEEADSEGSLDMGPGCVREFAMLLFPLLVESSLEALRSFSLMSSHDSRGRKLREEPFAVAASKRAASLWLDKRVRNDTVGVLLVAPSFMCAYVESRARDRASVVPQLLASGLGLVCLEEMEAAFGGGETYCRKLLRGIQAGEWRGLVDMASHSGAAVDTAAQNKTEEQRSGCFNAVATAVLTLALDAVRYRESHENTEEESWCAGDAEMLERVIWGCLTLDGHELNHALLAVGADAA
eukprot:3267249-Rhodomonas_salina.1